MMSAHAVCIHLAKHDNAYRSIPARTEKARGETLYRRFTQVQDDMRRIGEADSELREAGKRPPPVRNLDPKADYMPSTGDAADDLIRELTVTLNELKEKGSP